MVKELTATIDHKLLSRFVFIHSPFCGTCRVARRMLLSVEEMVGKELFTEINAIVHPTFMQGYKIESVPCLLIIERGEVVERIYAFRSVAYIYSRILLHQP